MRTMSMPDRMRNLWTLGGLSFADLLRRTARECWHDEVFGQGGRMAFYHFLAIFPSLLVLFTICARVPHVGDHMKNALQDLISQVLPNQASQLFQVITDELNDHTHSNVPLISVCAAGLWAALNGTWWEIAITITGLTFFLVFVGSMAVFLIFCTAYLRAQFHGSAIALRLLEWLVLTGALSFSFA